MKFRPGRVLLWMGCLCAMLAVVPREVRGDDELDNSKYKLQFNGWISAPTGYFNGAGQNGHFDLQMDFGFGCG